MRFSNEVEQEGISLFPELHNLRNTSKWRVQQVEKALNNLTTEEIIEILNAQTLSIHKSYFFVMQKLHIKREQGHVD